MDLLGRLVKNVLVWSTINGLLKRQYSKDNVAHAVLYVLLSSLATKKCLIVWMFFAILTNRTRKEFLRWEIKLDFLLRKYSLSTLYFVSNLHKVYLYSSKIYVTVAPWWMYLSVITYQVMPLSEFYPLPLRWTSYTNNCEITNYLKFVPLSAFPGKMWLVKSKIS